MQKIWLLGGTTEGKELVDFFEKNQIKYCVSVATPFGRQVLPQRLDHGEVCEGRLDVEEMKVFMAKKEVSMVVDATHPYAKEVSKNIRSACEAGKRRLIRVSRKSQEPVEDAFYFQSAAETAGYLDGQKGNVLLTTGSKDLGIYTTYIKDKKRIYARILSMEQSLELAKKAGLSENHLFCDLGPFSVEQNVTMIKSCNAKWVVSKDTGIQGGFMEKVEAVRECKSRLLVIRRPEDAGISMEETKRLLLDMKEWEAVDCRQ